MKHAAPSGLGLDKSRDSTRHPAAIQKPAMRTMPELASRMLYGE